MDNRRISVQALNYDRSARKSWTAELIQENEDLIVLLGVFDHEISHPQLGVLKSGTVSKEFFFQHRWYNVFEFSEPDGTFRNYYCNVSMPPAFDGALLTYIDLDIDVVVKRDGKIAILDRDEFEENAKKLAYPRDVVEKAECALRDLLAMIEGQDPLFTRVGS